MFLFWNVCVPLNIFNGGMVSRNMVTKEDIMKRFLRKLVNLNIWGGRHTELTNLRKCLPTHLSGERIVEKSLDELVKGELIIMKLSTGETHVSLNPHKKNEIYDLLKE